MISFTVPIAVKNIQKMSVDKFDISGGGIVVTIFSAGSPACQRTYALVLSDVLNTSDGLAVNSAPQLWDDTVVPVRNVGAVNSLQNAIDAYNGQAGGKAAKLNAVLARGVTDGWLTSAFAGS